MIDKFMGKKKALRISGDVQSIVFWLERTTYIVKTPKQIAEGVGISYRRTLEALNLVYYIQRLNPVAQPMLRYTGNQYQTFWWLVSRDEGKK
jgi:hypothetical protein